MRQNTARGITLILVLCSFTLIFSFINPPREITLRQALNEKLVKLEVKANGGLSDENLQLELKNLSSKSLKIEIQAGTEFASVDPELQDLLLAEPLLVDLKSSSTKRINLQGFCTQSSNRCPKEGSNYNYRNNTNPDLITLATFITENPELYKDEDLIQSAVWAISNNAGVSSIYNPEIEAADELRKLCCDLTKQEDVWYNTEREINIDQWDYIQSAPMTVNGKLKMELDAPLEVDVKLNNQENETVWQRPSKMKLPKGKFETSFELTVEGWPHGDYEVVYHAESDTLLMVEFTI